MEIRPCQVKAPKIDLLRRSVNLCCGVHVVNDHGHEDQQQVAPAPAEFVVVDVEVGAELGVAAAMLLVCVFVYIRLIKPFGAGCSSLEKF